MTPLALLALQQQALLQALYQPRLAEAVKITAGQASFAGAAGFNHLERGLQAYRSNGRLLAQRVLEAAYPVVAELLGPEGFEGLARHFWQTRPPACGDLALWGGAFAAFIETLDELHHAEPYLADVARVEWALHGLATAADGPTDLSTLALLATEEPTGLALRLAPGTAGLVSGFPVVSILQAHRTGEPPLAVVGERLRAGVAESALVWRQGFKPMVRQALAGEIIFITALQENQSLADSLTAAPDLDFHQWLALAAHTGLLQACGAVSNNT